MSGIGVGHFVEGLLVLEVGDVFLLARESCTFESISCDIFGQIYSTGIHMGFPLLKEVLNQHC